MILKLYNTHERAKFYNELLETYAEQAHAPIALRFVKELPGQELLTGWQINGRATWQPDHFLIMVRNDLDPKTELQTVAHELAHILAGHVARVPETPPLQNIRNANYANWVQGKTSAAVTHQTNERERAADALAEKILREWNHAGISAA